MKALKSYLDSDIAEIGRRLDVSADRLSGRTVLLCGGAGFLGRYFVSAIAWLNAHRLEKPCRLIVCDNHITSGEAGAHLRVKGVEFRTHDIVKPLKLDEPVDYVLQAAGIASPYYYRKYPLETLEVATVGTHRMLDMARKMKDLRGFLFFSSSEIYGDPDPLHVPTPESYRGNISCLGPRACYDESKRLGETLCTIFHYRYGVPTTIVRPFNVYGPGMQEKDYRVLPNFASRIIADKPLHVYGNGRQTRTFCYITDAIVGFLKVLLEGTPGQAYNIGNPVPEISMMELAEILQRIVGKRIEMRLVEYPDSYPADEPQRRCPDISKAALQVGYRPAVPLDEGLRRFYEWAKTHYKGAV